MSEASGPQGRRDLLLAWQASCAVRQGSAGLATGPETLAVVAALQEALLLGSPTAGLGRAARSWGSRFTSPVSALATLRCLREVLSDRGTAAPLRPALERVFDQLMLEAVDAASGTLARTARTDPLTGCGNRLALGEDLARALSSARRSGLDLAVAMIDLDGLKQTNDTQGHAAGDATLRGLVDSLRQCLRDADGIYRSGGDEFVVLAPFTDAAGARELMLRATCSDAPPFSWGVASLRSGGLEAAQHPEMLLMLADADMYMRRRNVRRAAAAGARRRRAAVAGTVAATLAVASGAVALGTSGSGPDLQGALPGSAGVAPPSNGRPTTSGPPSTPAPAPSGLTPHVPTPGSITVPAGRAREPEARADTSTDTTSGAGNAAVSPRPASSPAGGALASAGLGVPGALLGTGTHLVAALSSAPAVVSSPGTGPGSTIPVSASRPALPTSAARPALPTRSTSLAEVAAHARPWLVGWLRSVSGSASAGGLNAPARQRPLLGLARLEASATLPAPASGSPLEAPEASPAGRSPTASGPARPAGTSAPARPVGPTAPVGHTQAVIQDTTRVPLVLSAGAGGTTPLVAPLVARPSQPPKAWWAPAPAATWPGPDGVDGWRRAGRGR